MILLSDLMERLQGDVPAQGGVPSETQYEQAIADAVADFSRRAGKKKFGTLNIVSGTATYDLPADFLKMISLPSLATDSGVLNTASGLIPLPLTGFSEETTIRGGQITFRPTPAYTLAREYSYKAAWVLTDDDYGDYYDEMGEEEAGIVTLLAQSLATVKQANAKGSGISYRQGDVSVDTTGAADELRGKAKGFETDYLAAVDSYNGQVLMR